VSKKDYPKRRVRPAPTSAADTSLIKGPGDFPQGSARLAFGLDPLNDGQFLGIVD